MSTSLLPVDQGSEVSNYREFKGDEWLGRPIQVPGAPLQLVQESAIQWDTHHAITRAGRKAKVYRARRSDSDLAVKVFFKRFLDPINAITTMELRRFKHVQGLRVCDREFISEDVARILDEPGLAFAILMPWIGGKPWIDLVASKYALSQYSCYHLAKRTAAILAGLEAEHLAHADVSSSNVFIDNLGPHPVVELIDVEDMYHPTFIDVPHVPDGTDGYGHPFNVGQGCRNSYGDRFAGSILLAEMMSWHQPAIREHAHEESLFTKNELCQSGPKFMAVRAALRAYSPSVATLFEQAWRSSGLSECPSLTDWRAALATEDVASNATREPGPEPPIPEALSAPCRVEPRIQTSIIDTNVCSECGRRVLASHPTGHARSCSHHPTRFTPELDSSGWLTKPSDTAGLPPEFRRLLMKYSERIQACPVCGHFLNGARDNTNAADCPNHRKPGHPPTAAHRPLPQFDDVSFVPFDRPGGPA
jgi:hypothetical protein